MSDNNIINNESILYVDVVDEMKKSYIDYSMSVIVGRALPDVRDGLKPVHRRILYAMGELGFTYDKAHRKSARIVGEVIGKYHPHGDSSIYGALVRFAQDFSMRYPLIDGQGNFGSIDGDQPAAMRYTEARMSKLSEFLLKDIDKNTVDFVPNFDETEQQPVVLPSRFPNLLVNGANGIAVGMATYIPPHNLSEVINAIIKLIENPNIDIYELMEYIKAPDFPTGAEILGLEGIKRAYKTGRGRVVLRAITEFEELKNGKTQIVVKEIPYQVNKSKLVEEIAELIKQKRIDGITALRDESNREGIRIVCELRRDVTPSVILNQLYKMSQLQHSMGITMLALDKGQPKVLNLKEILVCYLNHQIEVETKRVEFDLQKTRDRLHIIAGLRIAIDNIDEVIRIIRNSYNDAELRLMERFNLSDVQAKAIVELRLRRLQGLEREKLEQEYTNLLEVERNLLLLLENRDLLINHIKTDLENIKEQFGDKRKTIITYDQDEIDIEDLIEPDDIVITLTNAGYVKRVSQSEYSSQNRGGRGKTGVSTREEDFIKEIYATSTHDNLLFFTNLGKAYVLKAYQIPEASRIAKGTAIINLLALDQNEKIAALMPIKESVQGYIAMCTKKGTIKKVHISHLSKINKNGKRAINFNEDDELISVLLTSGNDDLILTTKNGKSICFSEEDIRPTGTSSIGVKAMKLSKIDEIVSMDIFDESSTLLTITENGFGKRTNMSEYRKQKRGGSGIITCKFTSKSGRIIGAESITETDHLMLISDAGQLIRIRISDIPVHGRVTSGVKVMRLEEDSKIVSIAKIKDAESDEIEESIEDNILVDPSEVDTNE